MHFDDVVFLDVEDVHQLHDDALRLAGGAEGVLDPRLIESAVMAPRSGYYTTFAELAASYVFGLAKNHGYVEGNKRTAFLVLMTFLEANGFSGEAGPEWEWIIAGVADGSISRDRLAREIATRLLHGNPVPLE